MSERLRNGKAAGKSAKTIARDVAEAAVEAERKLAVLAGRRARFRAALALARRTAKRWCADNLITEQHLYAVLSGARESASLVEKIEVFIKEFRVPPSGR